MPNIFDFAPRSLKRGALVMSAAASLAGCTMIESVLGPPPPPSPACAAASAAAGWTAPWVRAGSERIGFEELARRAADSRVVLVGEAHDRFDHHLTQLELICRLHAADPDLAIGMEFFQQPFQQPLDDYVAGNGNTDTLLRDTEYFSRWRYDFRLYAPLLEFAREQRIPVIALNVPSEITRKIARQGRAALSAEERASLPSADAPVGDDYRARIRAVFDQHPEVAGGNFDNFLAAQLLWDEGMAAHAADYLARHPGRHMVVLAGAGHVSPDAIPRRLARHGGLEPLVVQPGEASTDPEVDFVVEASPIPMVPAGKLGVYLSEDDQGVKVEHFAEDSGAHAAGVTE